MSLQILIHAGFHKTGTTTLQNTFVHNRELLSEHLNLHLRYDFALRGLNHAVVHFSGNRNKQAKALIREEADFFFACLDRDDPRPIFISHENLSGSFIGDFNIGSYAAAPIAMEIIYNAWKDWSGQSDGFRVYYSTRREGWIESCHWQRLKSDRERRSLEMYLENYQRAADHQAILKTARKLLGQERVVTRDLLDMEHPAKTALQILKLSHLWSELELPKNANRYPGGDARERLLELNRSDLRGKAYWEKHREIVYSHDKHEAKS